MKKIAITTMTQGSNYGNVLQNYAVVRLIEKLGYEAETLNITTKNGYVDALEDNISTIKKLRPSYIWSWYQSKNNSLCGAKNDEDFIYSNLKKLKENKQKWIDASKLKDKRFNEFKKKYLNYTNFEVNNNNLNISKLKQYDAYITGSDQVWNPHYRTNSSIEFLQFAPKEKRIAFAPSFGVSIIPEQRKENYRKWVNEIPYLSVRENEGKEIIKKLTGRDCEVLLDPTFGLTKKEWLSFIKKPIDCALEPNSYAFCYFLGNRTKKYTKYIKEYANRNNLRIIDVLDVQQLENYSYSPQEFVWLLANAKAVFTDSFHGCALSINLNKPFVVFDRSGDGCITQSSRISTILSKTKLTNGSFNNINDIDTIDFEESNKIVKKERNRINSFLKESLESALNTNASIRLAIDNHCTGCGACANVCPKKAINMIEDEEGFLYPSINSKKCINCKKCESACPADNNIELNDSNKAYYAYSNNKDTCINSSSGGIFSELARNVIKKKGIVFGAGFDENFNVCHMSAENEEELANLRTSKYVQSDTKNIYIQVKKGLNTGRNVLFSGTPCQIVALKTYLNKEFDNLLLVDIICHGVPSPKIWRKYLKEEHNKEITKVSFRNKDIGWNEFSMKVNYEDGTQYRKLATEDSFVKSFLANLSLRPSCYQCQYKTIDRVSDITIADYWGVETVYPELKEQQGVSLVITHSSKGESLLDEIKNNIEYGITNIEKAISMNSACLHSVILPKNRSLFFSLQSNNSLKDASNTCLKQTAKEKTIRLFYKYGSKVKRLMRKIIK